ncbi:MAG: hypothetical protein V1833_07535 [Elusimicrobiota bacterium]
MKKFISVLFVLGFVVSGFCQVEQQAAPVKAASVKKVAPVAKVPVANTLRMRGTVASVDAAKGEVVVSVVDKEKKSVDETVTTDEKTKITKAGKKITFADVINGEKISVVYFVSADRKIAKSISVLVQRIRKQTAPAKKEIAPVKKEVVPVEAPAKK